MTFTTAPFAAPYEAGNRLFRGTRWRGSDDSYTVDLGDGRTLWLFGDTFVADEGKDTRVGSHFVNNTIGLQTGLDPATATMEFRWEDTADGPKAFFPGEGEHHYFWPYHGVRLGDRVLVFAMLVGPPSGQRHDSGVWDVVPFTVESWRAFWLDGIDGPLVEWTVSRADRVPSDAPGILGASVLLDGDTLYVWSYRDGSSYLARFDAAAATVGDLSQAEWWEGSGWTADPQRAVPALTPSTTEFTVHRRDGRYLLVDVHSFGVPETGVQIRWADRPEGPWSQRTEVYRIPEASREGVICYAGKGHPELAGPGLLVTYASNTGGLDDVIWTDESLYYPRFVRVDV
ncbi:MAG: hypothetical protein QOK42_2837 [Frankiaceae bacterium]|nr:hypothetical protein [Frankiaceae bacterium]